MKEEKGKKNLKCCFNFKTLIVTLKRHQEWEDRSFPCPCSVSFYPPQLFFSTFCYIKNRHRKPHKTNISLEKLLQGKNTCNYHPSLKKKKRILVTHPIPVNRPLHPAKVTAPLTFIVMASFHSLQLNHSSIHPCTCPFFFFFLT